MNRVRPPRCLYKDSIIRPYKLKEAQGVFILKVDFIRLIIPPKTLFKQYNVFIER